MLMLLECRRLSLGWMDGYYFISKMHLKFMMMLLALLLLLLLLFANVWYHVASPITRHTASQPTSQPSIPPAEQPSKSSPYTASNTALKYLNLCVLFLLLFVEFFCFFFVFLISHADITSSFSRVSQTYFVWFDLICFCLCLPKIMQEKKLSHLFVFVFFFFFFFKSFVLIIMATIICWRHQLQQH